MATSDQYRYCEFPPSRDSLANNFVAASDKNHVKSTYRIRKAVINDERFDPRFRKRLRLKQDISICIRGASLGIIPRYYSSGFKIAIVDFEIV